jgi:hypothetical protein
MRARSNRPGQGAVLKKNPKQGKHRDHLADLKITAWGVNGPQADEECHKASSTRPRLG